MSLFDDALKTYQNHLSSLEASITKNKIIDSEEILALLASRDIIQVLLIKNGKSQKIFNKPSILIENDDKLEELFEKIFNEISDDFLIKARKSFHPNSDAWWWFIEPKKSKNWLDRHDKLWNFLSVVFIIISTVLMYEIYSRFSRGNPDAWAYIFIGLNATIVTSIFGMIFTDEGETIANKILHKIINFCGLNINLKQELRMIISLLFLVITGLVIYFMPWASEKYTQSGIKLYDQGETSKIISAQSKFDRAIALNPDNKIAYYYQGLIQENLDDIESASRQYLISKRNGDIESINNLARLYILDEKYGKAATKLNAIDISTINISDIHLDGITLEDLKFRITKNLAWARLKQERYDEADGLLTIANGYNPEDLTKKAAYFCLKPQVMEKIDSTNLHTICSLWNKCIAYADDAIFEEDKWIGIADRKLKSCK